MQSDRNCPHCGVQLRAKAGPRPGWVLFSLAMAGCPAEDLYGAPDPGPDETTSQGSETSAGGDAVELNVAAPAEPGDPDPSESQEP